MVTATNEKLFQEIGKLQRKIRQIMPPPHHTNSTILEKRHHPQRPDMPKRSHPHPPKREYILRILISEETGMRQKQISEIMGIGAPALSETIDRLEADNYIKRISDPDDRRATRILLTEKGKARAYEIQDNHAENIDKLFGNLSDDEKTQLITLLQKING